MNAALHDAYAAEYDDQVRAYDSHVHEALFGLCYELLQPGQRLLDLGIGTGLAAALFARAGLRVHGMDFSPAMLELCQAKGFAAELTQQDILHTPWPVSALAFDAAICCGVFHFIPDLEAIFGETQRTLKDDGIFAFTTKAPAVLVDRQKKYDHMSSGGMDIFAHSSEYIIGLLQHTGFELRKAMRCFVGEDIFVVWIAYKPGGLS
jgi:predicted TPR repeat methyltransferase